MIQKLPTNLREAMGQQPNELLRLEDDQTQTVYVVVEEQTHQKAMQALREQEDWNAIRQGLKEREEGLGKPLAEVDAELREKFGFPLRDSFHFPYL